MTKTASKSLSPSQAAALYLLTEHDDAAVYVPYRRRELYVTRGPDTTSGFRERTGDVVNGQSVQRLVALGLAEKDGPSHVRASAAGREAAKTLGPEVAAVVRGQREARAFDDRRRDWRNRVHRAKLAVRDAEANLLDAVRKAGYPTLSIIAATPAASILVAIERLRLTDVALQEAEADEPARPSPDASPEPAAR